jgi:hypothetical protein
MGNHFHGFPGRFPKEKELNDYLRNHMLRLYAPLLRLFRPWESISMDFLGGFPRKRNGMTIFLWLWIDLAIFVSSFL